MRRNLLVAAATLVALGVSVEANTVQIYGPPTSHFGSIPFPVGDSAASNTLTNPLNVSFTQRDMLTTISSSGGLSLEISTVPARRPSTHKALKSLLRLPNEQEK